MSHGSISHEPDTGDRAGPINMGLALSRQQGGSPRPPLAVRDKTRRAVVIAGSDFMGNGHIGALDNRTLALVVFQWLGHRDAQIAVNIAGAPDARLQMTPARIRDMWKGFAVIPPLALMTIGVGRWWRRH